MEKKLKDFDKPVIKWPNAPPLPTPCFYFSINAIKQCCAL